MDYGVVKITCSLEGSSTLKGAFQRCVTPGAQKEKGTGLAYSNLGKLLGEVTYKAIMIIIVLLLIPI